MNLKQHLIDTTGRDLRACFADVFGYSVLTPDQEKHTEALQTQPRVAAMGGTGVGKSCVQGTAAAIVIPTSFPSKGLFGGPKLDQALLLSWLELQRAIRRAEQRGIRLGAKPGIAEWYPGGKDKHKDWFAQCMALSDQNEAAAVRGMMHSKRSLAVFDELEGIALEVRNAIDDGMTQDNAHMWVSFNPVNPKNQAGLFWEKTPEAGRVHYSALDCAEWQERTGNYIPGMPTLAAIEAKWKGQENDPRYYITILGEFPPETADWVVVPKDWYRKCVNCIPEPTVADKQFATLGIDTGGGRAETGGIGIQGRVVLPARASREVHDTIRVAVFMRDFALSMGPSTRCIVDWIGLGGKGVGEQLLALGCQVLVFRGGARTITQLVASETEEDVATCPDLYADNATWAYFVVRELARKTVEAIDAGRPERYISFEDDDLLCDQLARRFSVDAKDKRYVLESKRDSGKASPDRGDMLAMAALANSLPVTTSRIVTAAEVMPELAGMRETIGERWYE